MIVILHKIKFIEVMEPVLHVKITPIQVKLNKVFV
jgi:hypothetical protein